LQLHRGSNLLMGIFYIKENELLSAVHGVGCAELNGNIRVRQSVRGDRGRVDSIQTSPAI